MHPLYCGLNCGRGRTSIRNSWRQHPPFDYHYCLLLGREFGSCCMQMEHSVHDVFLVNETDLWEGHGLLQIPFKLCNAQPQFLWYGLLSTSMSFNEILASKTPPNII